MSKALNRSAFHLPNDTPERTIFRSMEGLIEMVCPVQASSARPASIQSVVPSRFTVVIDVLDALVDINAEMGVVDVILW